MNDKYLLVWIMTHALAKFHVLDPHHAKKRNASLVSLQISPEMHHTWGRHKRHDSGLHMAAHGSAGRSGMALLRPGFSSVD